MVNKRLTLNGIDGFLSGKWTKHPNVLIVDDENAILNASDKWQSTDIDLDIDAGTYNFTGRGLPNGMYIDAYLRRKSDGVTVTTLYAILNESRNFTVPSDQKYYIRVRILNSNGAIGKFSFKLPMLVKGSIPIPFEPKKGDVMVEPKHGKNKFAYEMVKPFYRRENHLRMSTWANDLLEPNMLEKMFKPDTHYTLSSLFYVHKLSSLPVFSNVIGFVIFKTNNPYTIYLSNENNIVAGNWYERSVTFKTPPSLKEYSLLAYTKRYTDGVTVELGDVSFYDIQIEEGKSKTNYEPHEWKLNQPTLHNKPNLR